VLRAVADGLDVPIVDRMKLLSLTRLEMNRSALRYAGPFSPCKGLQNVRAVSRKNESRMENERMEALE
jgi:hypothetical protein